MSLHSLTTNTAECIFFNQGDGYCSRGVTCQYLHAVRTEGLSRVSFSKPPARHSTFFYNTPSGPRDFPPTGPAGWQRSSSRTTPRRAEPIEHVAHEETTIPEEGWVRHLKGVYVTFGPGATVATVAMPWEYSAVRLTNLPKDFHKSAIAEHLHHKLGIEVPESRIDSQPACGGEETADITMLDADFAKRLLAALEDDDSTEFKAVSITPNHYRAAKFNQISSSKVNCSWHKPSRMAWLNFGSLSTATTVKKMFASGNYRVDQNWVVPSAPEANDGVNASTWKIKITNVPASASRSEITECLPKDCLPYHIELSRASYSIPVEAAVNAIIKMLVQIGPLDPSVITSTEGQGRRFQMTARFVNADDALDAVKILHYKPLPFHAHGKLTVQQVFTVRMRVADHVYAAASQDIEALHRDWSARRISTSISPPSKGFRDISLEGQSHDQVVDAQTSLESVVAGELLTDDDDDGRPLWSASLATNAWAYNEMRDLERRLGILVLCDRNQRTLRILGPRHMFGTARSEIAKLCHRDPRAEFSIRLDPEALPWLLGGGYQHIGRIVGSDKVRLDIVSEPRRLVISGSEADLQVAQDIYHNRSQSQEHIAAAAAAAAAASAPGPQDCALCGCEAEYPVFTRCRHLFCTSCFEDMCLSCAGTHTRTPAVRCYGDGGLCRELLALAAIQASISSAALERVFEKMFATFVGANAKQYRYCPTPGCEQVYRVAAAEPAKESGDGENSSSSSNSSTDTVPIAEFEFCCPQCQVAICSVCHVSHDTLHCPLRVVAS